MKYVELRLEDNAHRGPEPSCLSAQIVFNVRLDTYVENMLTKMRLAAVVTSVT